MLFNVINYDNQVIGQVEAGDAMEAWSEAGRRYSNILDIREVKSITFTEAAKKARVETTLISERECEGVITFITDVYNELGEPVLQSIWRELDDVIVLAERYAKPGEAMKGYGTRAFVEGPMARSLEIGKPMVVGELSHDAAEFYNALERKGIARFRMTPNEKYTYKIDILLKA